MAINKILNLYQVIPKKNYFVMNKIPSSKTRFVDSMMENYFN